MSVDEQWMRLALLLAQQGRGYVEPNPMVGAVVIDSSGQEAGRGWHQQFGGPHAEVFALQAAGKQARGGTLYVSLEPCSHHGKTPPCADAVIAVGIARVVIGCTDPAAHVNGQGIAKLRQAGIEVVVGVLEQEAQDLIAPFRTLMLSRRPFVHAKWAMTLDGRIASRSGHSQWISGPESRAIVHELRGQMDAMLVGIGTALADDPLLTARPPGPRTPLRIVLDSQLRLPLTSQLVCTAANVPVLVFHVATAAQERKAALGEAGIELIEVPNSKTGRLDINAVLQELGKRQVTNLLVEGGSDVLGAFFDADHIDEYHVFIAPKLIGGSGAPGPLGGQGLDQIPQVPSLKSTAVKQIQDDIYVNGRVNR